MELKNKITSMKSMVKELNQEFENQLKKKDEKYKEKNQIIMKQIDEYSKKESNYINQIEILTTQSKDFQNQLNNYIRERTTMEDIIIRQEEKLNVLVNKLNQVEDIIKRKNRILKENEAYAIELIKIVEQQKSQINQYKINNRVLDRNTFSNTNLFSKYNQFNNKINLDNDEKINYNYNSMDFENKDKGVVLPIINTYNSQNINNERNVNDIIIEKEEDKNEKKIEEFKSMMDQLIDDIEN